MNRPYRDVPESVFVECPVCLAQVRYLAADIDAHEQACEVPSDFDPTIVTHPALDPATIRRVR